MLTPTVDVNVDCHARGIPPAATIKAWVEAALAVAGLGERALEVSVRVVDEDTIRALNRDYRGKDEPTNVLSFPAGELHGLPAEAARPFGDIVVCASIVAAEARASRKAVANHWAHMLVHGTLHLAGFDHVSDEDAARMESLEVRILAREGIADPYGMT